MTVAELIEVGEGEVLINRQPFRLNVRDRMEITGVRDLERSRRRWRAEAKAWQWGALHRS